NDTNEDSTEEGSGSASESSSSAELGESELTIPDVAWAGAIARTPMVAQVLEEVGYTVETSQVESGAMYSSVANDDASFMTASWLPATDQTYWDQYSEDLEDLGNFVDSAPLSLTVPSYMDVDSIEDLQGNQTVGQATDWTITGIDAGAGVMLQTETAIEEYGLENWELQASSEGAMLSELQSAVDNEEPIVITGWQPHWMFSEMDLTMLEDPQEIYGGEGDRIGALAHTSFQEDSPAAYEVMQRILEDYDQEMENELLVMGNVEGLEPAEAASQFLENNPDLLESWTEGLGE